MEDLTNKIVTIKDGTRGRCIGHTATRYTLIYEKGGRPCDFKVGEVVKIEEIKRHNKRNCQQDAKESVVNANET